MNSRIKQFIEYKGITPSEFADSIGVQRSNVTHVLHNRNKPSFPFLSKMLETFPEINAKWLLLGKGQMLENQPPNQSDLFSEPSKAVETTKKETIEPSKLSTEVLETAPQEKTSEKDQMPIITGSSSKSVERIVVFYTDQTFKQYTPSN